MVQWYCIVTIRYCIVRENSAPAATLYSVGRNSRHFLYQPWIAQHHAAIMHIDMS